MTSMSRRKPIPGKVRHLILSEQGLLSAHYAFGLIDVNGNKQPSFEVYKNLQ